jgi:hypothetical protein
VGNDHSVSELGLDQSEDSFQLSSTTKLKTKRTVTSRVDCLLETVFQSQGRRNVPEGKRKDLERGLQQGTSGRFTTRTEDLCTVQQKAIVQCPLVCSWGRQKLGWNEACAGGSGSTLERRQPCNALFSLIVVLNRNTLAPSTIRSTERGR